MQKEPPPFVWAAPDEKNILNCEYRCVYPILRMLRELPQGITSLYVGKLVTLNYPVLKPCSEGLRTPPLLAESIMASCCSHRSIHLSLLALRCVPRMSHEFADS